jgi:hypothetical protein
MVMSSRREKLPSAIQKFWYSTLHDSIKKRIDFFVLDLEDK